MATATPDLLARAYAFDKLTEHLQKRNDVQNIDLMILAGFCRNCLSKWCVGRQPWQADVLSPPHPTAKVSRGRSTARARHELRRSL